MIKEDCIFCKIANKQIPTELIYEDENIVAFNDLHPKAPVHVLIIPKNHYDSLNELYDERLIGQLFNGVRKVAEKLNVKDYRTIVNTGPSAGQVVFHLHIHLLAKREMLWPPD